VTERRRPGRGRQRWEADLSLRWRFGALYGAHEPFTEALGQLYEEHASAVETEADEATSAFIRYEAAVREVAAAYGLDRFPDGAQLVDAWCRQRAADKQAGGPVLAPSQFHTVFIGAGAYPGFGEVVSRDEFVVERPLGRVIVVDERRRPIVRVAFESVWDARREPRADARKRLLAEAANQIDTELERLACQAEAAGYGFEDTAPKQAEHLRWLFPAGRCGSWPTGSSPPASSRPCRTRRCGGP
jgi:hypothetical protein